MECHPHERARQLQQQRRQKTTDCDVVAVRGPFIRSGSSSSINLRQLILGAILITLLASLLAGPYAGQQQSVEAKKIKGKTVLKQLVKGLVYKNLSTKKNFLPMPVPIPVPIELSEPPVYIKGKPKYVTIYKPAPPPPPVVKPMTVYHMPIYSPTYEYMMDPMGLYGNMMLVGGKANSYGDKYSGGSSMKQANSANDLPLGVINFTDYDDDIGNYYLRTKPAGSGSGAGGRTNGNSIRQMSSTHRADDDDRASSSSSNKLASGGGGDGSTTIDARLMATDEQESLDTEDGRELLRTKRQAYESSYEHNGEPPCYGFPLEINIKSRIKMDQIFPIHGKSQFRKCIKVGRPLLPPVEDHPPY